MEGVGNISQIADKIVSKVGTASKSSTIDKQINLEVNKLLKNGKDYSTIRSFKQSLKKSIQNINNPGHDLSLKKNDRKDIIKEYGNELKNDF